MFTSTNPRRFAPHFIRKSSVSILGVALFAAGSMLMPASAAPITLNVVADTFTSAANQSLNYGASVKVNIENESGNFDKDRVGFFRFDLESWTGGTISGATFTLFPFEQISSTPQNFDIYGISNGGASENFEEGAGTGDAVPGLTWSNSGYGYNSGESLSDSANFSDLVNLGTLTGVTQDDQGGSVDFSSAALDTFLNNDTNNIATFLVYNTNGTGSFNGFYSKEHSSSDGSTLTVVPEPSSVILVALGLVAAFGLARKRRG